MSAFEETWFYVPEATAGVTLALPAGEKDHALRALRLRPGTEIRVCDGAGSVYRGQLADGESGRVEIQDRLIHEPEPPGISVALVLLKGNDLEIPVEAICEFPLHGVFLVRTDHSSEFRGQNFEKLLERLRRKSLVALKQAKKPWLTLIHGPEDLKTWRERNRHADLIVAHPGMSTVPNPLPRTAHLLVGPEGGFSKAEEDYLFNFEKAFRLSLGPTRLRAIHAPTAALGCLFGGR